MARGKKAAQAASRRAHITNEAVMEARRQVAEANARMGAMEVRHRAEMQRAHHDHLAHLDDLVQQRLDAEVERAVAQAVEARWAARERSVRLEAARIVGEWLGAQKVGANMKGWADLARALRLGEDAGILYAGEKQNRHGRRTSVAKMEKLAALAGESQGLVGVVPEDPPSEAGESAYRRGVHDGKRRVTGGRPS